MIYLFAAMQCELEPFVAQYSLTSINDAAGSIYSGENIVAAVTGVGKVNAAFMVSRVLALYPPDLESVIVNVGVAGGVFDAAGDPGGAGVFLINDIYDIDTDKHYYPDMIYDLGLPERGLKTSSVVVSSISDNYLYDMEASAVFSVASKFVSPERIFVIKTISDSGADSNKVTPDFVKSLMSGVVPVVDKIIDAFPSVDHDDFAAVLADFYAEQLYCSEYMRNELSGLVHFAVTLGLAPGEIMADIAGDFSEITCRKQGKEVLDEFRRRLTT